MTARVIQLRPDAAPAARGPLTDDEIAAVYARGRTLPPARKGRRPRRKTRRVLVAVVLASAAAVLVAILPTSPSNVDGGATPSVVTSAPTDGETLRWHSIDGVYFPLDAAAGPQVFDISRASGFDGTDLGAALAAVHIVYRASPAPGPSSFEPALREQVVGPAAGQLALSVRQDYEEARRLAGLGEGAPLPAGTVAFLGYRVTPLTDGNRSVQIIEQGPDANGVLQPFAFDVVVTRVRGQEAAFPGDWKVVAPPTGVWASAFTQLPNVPGDMVPFAPTSPGSVLGAS